MARSRSIGNVYAELSVKDKMTAGLGRAQKSLGKFASSVASIGTGLVLAAPAAALAGITASMKSAIDAGGKLNDMMLRTGADGEQLFILQRAFENAGVAGDKVPGVLNKMQKALAGVNEEGERVQNRVFSDLGLSVEKLRSMDPAAAFRSISGSIAAIPDPAKRAAIAMEIFGRSGGELLAIMNDGKAFELAAQQVGGLGKTLADNAARLDEVGDALGAVGTKFQQIGATVAVELLPYLEDFAAWLNETDLGGMTSQAIEFAKAVGDIAAKLGDVAKYTPILKDLMGWGNVAESAIIAAAERNPEPGVAMPAPDFEIGGSRRTTPLVEDPKWAAWENLPDTGSLVPFMDEIKWMTEEAKYNRGAYEGQDPVDPMRLEDSGIPGVSAIIDAIAASVTPMETEDARRREVNVHETQYEVNEMQRRGLGFGGESAVVEAQKQVSILTQIRDLMKQERGLNWT